MEHPVQILERYWNYTSFRPLQEDIINAVLEGEDTFALLPTGGGKSVCFQIPALARDGICIVISPLIALMKDQVKSLKDKGIKAIALTSEIKYADLQVLLDNCIYGNYKFLYLSPERLQQEIIQNRIQQMPVNLIAVDEAHCISQWGNDFRPAYKNITGLRRLHPQVNVIALTASATPEVVDNIIEELDFIDPKIFRQSFRREHLAYMVLEEEDKHFRMEKILKKYKEPSIVYVRTRNNTFDISNHLERKGISSTFYHGGLSNSEKDKRFSQWYHNSKQVMVATNAFGMGINKPDVKTVIHVNLPDSLESYFQEAGRAGRNDEKAYAIVLKNKGDELHVKRQFLSVLPSVDLIKQVYRKLCNYFQISFGEGEFTVHDFDLHTFCKTYKFNTILTYNALRALDRSSIISLIQQFNKRSKVMFKVSNNRLFEYLDANPAIDPLIKSILRTYGGIFDHEVSINTHLMADKVSMDENAVIQRLIQLEKEDIIYLSQSRTDTQIVFIEPREDDKTVNRIANTIEQQNELKKSQVDSVLAYINNDDICKSKQLLSYFGEKDLSNCGICSVCSRNEHRTNNHDITQYFGEITKVLKKSPLSSREIVSRTHIKEEDITLVLKLMLEEKRIKITSTNTYELI